jgi:hypothetical protein
MSDTELLIPLAEIAGVFVGFGALIAVRSGGPSDPHEVTYLRSVVTLGVWVVIAAIAPVIVGRYGVTGHELWLVCGLLGLVLYLGLWIVNERTSEAREIWPTYSRAQAAREMALFWAFTAPAIGALALVVLGLFPDQEPALYLTAVGLVLSLGAITLLFLALSQRRVAASSGPAALTATGDLGA